MKITRKHIACIFVVTFVLFLIPCFIFTGRHIVLSYSVRSFEERDAVANTYPTIYSQKNNTRYLHLTIYKNVTGICYFNTCIQILQTDYLLVEYMISRTYDIKRQPVSSTIQNILVEVAKGKTVDLLEYVSLLARNRDLSDLVHKVGGSTTDCYIKIMKILYEENLEPNKVSFFMRHRIQNRFSVKCRRCGSINTINYFEFILPLPFKTTLEEDLMKREFDAQIKQLGSKKCEECNGSLNKKNMKVECILPEILVVTRKEFSVLACFKRKKNLEYPIKYDLIVGKDKYDLCGVTIESYDGKIGHICGFFKRNGSWYFYDDSYTTIINLQLGMKIVSERSWSYTSNLIYKLV